MSFYDRISKMFASQPSNSVIPLQQPKSQVLRHRDTLGPEIGDTGTESFHGFITQDYNAKFVGQNAITVYEEMRRSDATISAVLKALKLPIIQTEYMVESADADNELMNEQAEFVRKCLEEMEGGFKQHLLEALNYLDYGFYYFEKVYAVKNGKIVLKKLAPRLPSAHLQWVMNSTGELGVTQSLPTTKPGKSTSPEIPWSKLVVYTNQKEGDNYEGISVLRSAYKHWYLKNFLYKIDGMQHERGAGILMISLPDGSTDSDRNDAEQLGKNFKQNEQAFIVVPNEKWKVEMLTAGIESKSGNLMESVKHHDRMITMNVLAQFLDLGAGTTGSFALSKDQSSFFGLSLRAIADYVETVLNETVVPELVKFNWGEQENYPKLRLHGVKQIDYDEMSQVIERLLKAGAVKNDPQLKVWVHKTFGLPEVTVDDFDEESEKDEKSEDDDDEDEGVEEEVKEDMEEKDEGEFAERRYSRKLTAAEERVAFTEVEDYMDAQEGTLEEELAKLSQEQRDAIMKEAEKIIATGNISAIATLSLPALARLRTTLKDAANDALERGKSAAAQEISQSIPSNTNRVKKILNTRVDLLINERQDLVERAVKNALLAVVSAEVGKKAALQAVGEELDKYLNQSDRQLTGTLIVEFFNQGRQVVFENYTEAIYGLQWSAILDLKTCNMCASLDGRVFNVNDSFTNIKQVHTNCRCIWVAVLRTDANLPKIKQLPKTIRNRFETVEGVPSTNKFQQLKQPIVRKNSRLERKIKEGAVDV